MSSEMRKKHAETLKAVRSVFDGIPAPCAERDALDFAIALLARTEAGADGAAMLVRDVCEMAPADPDAPDTVCIRVSDLTRIAEQYTHPQDASGDAIEAQRYRWLRDEASRAQLEMFADRRGTRLAADRVCDAGIDIAMQAKEAKS